jgi:nitrogen fixation NifU-like protein
MSSDFKELEELIMSDMRRDYSEMVIEHFLRPRNLGEIQNADGFGKVTGPCGDTMKIYLRAKGGRIADATFQTDGCGTTIASGSIVTELVKGREVTEALRISSDDILSALGGLPEENLHCALLAANTLKGAINDYLALGKEPWKKAYRRR